MRRPPAEPLSLFAFQDIITSTTGILILICLLLCLSLEGALKQRAVDQSQSHGPGIDLGALQRELEQKRSAAEEQRLRVASLIAMSPSELQAQVDSLAAARATLQTRLDSIRSAIAREMTAAIAVRRAELTAEQEQLREIETKVREGRENLEQLRRENRVFYNFRGGTGSRPWLLDVRGERLTVARAGRSEAPLVFDQPGRSARLAAFEEWLEGLAMDDRYFVALVHPSGAGLFGALPASDAVRPLLENAGAEIGVDLLTEEQQAIDPLIGAGPK